MDSVEEAFESPKLLLSRAKEHIGDLNTRITTELCWNLGDAVIRRRSVLAC